MNSACRRGVSQLLTAANRLESLTQRGIASSSILRMPIKVGQSLPSVDLQEGNPGGKVNIADLAKGKKVIIFGVPGAFTPTCSKQHLPGFIADFDKIKAKGVSEIVCVSVNDAFVMAAWGEQSNAGGKIRMLADPNAEFTKAIDVAMDIPPLGGVRCKRFALLADNGVVKVMDVEPDGTGATCSLSNTFIKQL